MVKVELEASEQLKAELGAFESELAEVSKLSLTGAFGLERAKIFELVAVEASEPVVEVWKV